MKGTWSALGVSAFCRYPSSCVSLPFMPPMKPKRGELLVKLLQAGRSVISAHQELINDASKGNKGFTPDYMGDKMIEKYREMTKIDLRQPNSTPYNKSSWRSLIQEKKWSLKRNRSSISKALALRA